MLYDIRKVQETRLELDMYGTHQALAFADDVNLAGDDISTIERNADVLINACKDIGLVVNKGNIKYMKIGRHRGMIANEPIGIGSNSYEKVKIFKYLGSLVTNQNSIQNEIKCRLKAGNLCHYYSQTLLSSLLLTKNLKIKIYKTIILSVGLYGYEAWSFTLREERRLREFQNRILRRIFGPKRDVNGNWRRLHYEEPHSLYRSPNIVRMIKSRRLK